MVVRSESVLTGSRFEFFAVGVFLHILRIVGPCIEVVGLGEQASDFGVTRQAGCAS